jgi:quinol-cytochrome oxidoreductase complex cytochrome b subunit
MSLAQKLKPGVKKRTLLFVAGCAWTIAGGMLITRALLALIAIQHLLLIEIIIGIIAGACFYIFMFTRISKKHITRISLIKVDYPCFFSFFNLRSYILMSVMISGGILLRKSNIIAPEYLYTFYLAMGIPLLLSAFRFFKAGVKNVIQV